MFDIFHAMEVVEGHLIKSKVPQEYMVHWRKHRKSMEAGYILTVLMAIQCFFIGFCMIAGFGNNGDLWLTRAIYGVLIVTGMNIALHYIHKYSMKHFKAIDGYMKTTTSTWVTKFKG